MQVQYSSQSFSMEQTSFSYSSSQNNEAFRNELFSMTSTSFSAYASSTQVQSNSDIFSLESYRGQSEEEQVNMCNGLNEEHGFPRGGILFNAKMTASYFSNTEVQSSVLQVMGSMEYVESEVFSFDFQSRISAYLEGNKQTQEVEKNEEKNDDDSVGTIDFFGDAFKEFITSFLQDRKSEDENKEHATGLNTMKTYSLLMYKYEENISTQSMIQQYSNGRYGVSEQEESSADDPYGLNKYKDYANKTDEEKAELKAELEKEYPPGRSEIILNARINAARYEDPATQKMVLDVMSSKDSAIGFQSYSISFTKMTFSASFTHRANEIDQDSQNSTQESTQKNSDIIAQKSHYDFLQQNYFEMESVNFQSTLMMLSDAYKMTQDANNETNLSEEDFKDFDTDALLNMQYSQSYYAEYESFTAQTVNGNNGMSSYVNQQSFYTQEYFNLTASIQNSNEEIA